MDLGNFSLDARIGQLVMAGFGGLAAESAEMIDAGNIGNVILFSRNIASAEQTARLTMDLQQACLRANGLPAFIAVDQECGSVDRFGGVITPFPGNMALAAAAGDENEAHVVGRMLGRELRALGLHINLAPCVDVLRNPRNPGIGVRSYGSSPERVAGFGAALMGGLSQSRITGCAKHFPGSGDVEVDAHLGLPVISHSRDRLAAVELLPFRHVMRKGCSMVMVGHPVAECLDPRHPASLSPAVIKGLLVVKMGFTGIIITDCLEMEAVAGTYGTAGATVQAIRAGADMVCISHTPEKQLAAVRALKEAVESGVIPEERINRSFAKVVMAKRKAGLFRPGAFKTDPAAVRDGEHLAFAGRLYEKVPRLISGRWFLPGGRDTLVMGPVFERGNPAEDMPRDVPDFAGATGKTLGAGYLSFLPHLPAAEARRLSGACEQYRDIVLGLTETALFPAQREFYRKLRAAGKRIMAVSLRTPDDFSPQEAPACHICLFEYTAGSLWGFGKLWARPGGPDRLRPTA